MSERLTAGFLTLLLGCAGAAFGQGGPTVAIGDAVVVEGDPGAVTVAGFDVTFVLPQAAQAAQGQFVIDFATRDGTATSADGDYVERTGQLFFSSSETQTITIDVIGDATVEADETFFVDLSSSDPNIFFTDPEGQGTIQNDDEEEPSIIRLVAAPDVGEAAGRAVVTVERTGGAQGAASVTVATSPGGTATAGEDFTAASLRLSWADGVRGNRSFEVEILDDNLQEEDETVLIQLSDPSGATLGVPAELALLILDDDTATALEPVSETELTLTVDDEIELQARATREDGAPVQGASVVWRVEGDAELVGEPTTTSDAEGVATQQIRLGGSPGRVTVTAEIAPTGQTVSFEIVVEGDLDELFDPSEDPAESSVAEVLNEACFGAPPGMEDLCDYLFSLDPADQRAVIAELTPREAGALADLSLDAPYVQLLNLREHLAARRRGDAGGSTDRLAVSFGGQELPLGPLLGAVSGYGAAERRFAARIDAALFQQEEAGAAAAEPPEVDGDSSLSFFLSGRLGVGERPRTGAEEGFDLDTLGLTLGVDNRFTRRFILGGAVGYVDTETQLVGDGGGVDVRGYSLSAFGTYFRDKFWLDGILTYSRLDYDALRNVDLPQPFQGRLRFAARGRPDGEQLAVDWGVGYDASFGAATLGGFGRLSYIDAEVDAFTEAGAAPFNLAMSRQEIESLLLEVGMELVWAASLKWGVLQPVLRASLLHEFEDEGRILVGHFAADPGSNQFRVPTDPPDEDFFKLGAGLTATLARGRALYLLYETDLERDDRDLYRLAAGLRLLF